MTSTQKNTDFRNSKPQNTPLIPVCKYAKSTPWALYSVFLSTPDPGMHLQITAHHVI